MPTSLTLFAVPEVELTDVLTTLTPLGAVSADLAHGAAVEIESAPSRARIEQPTRADLWRADFAEHPTAPDSFREALDEATILSLSFSGFELARELLLLLLPMLMERGQAWIDNDYGEILDAQYVDSTLRADPHWLWIPAAARAARWVEELRRQGELTGELWAALAPRDDTEALAEARAQTTLEAACLLLSRPAETDLPLLRQLVDRETVAAQARGNEALRALCLALHWHGHVEDVLRIWKAKQSSFDAACYIDGQLLVGAGEVATRRFLSKQGELGEKITKYLDDVDLVDLEEHIAGLLQYYLGNSWDEADWDE